MTSPERWRFPSIGAGRVEELPFDRKNLVAVRTFVFNRAAAAGLESLRAAELVAAAGEAASNALEHGAGHGTVRLWQEADAIVCEVSDPGGGLHDRSQGVFPPPVDTEGGRGFWLIRQFCDLVEIENGASGTTVRMRVWLDRR